MLPIHSRLIAFRGRTVPSACRLIAFLMLDRCAINPEHCDVEFPAEPLHASREKSYSRLRFELSQLSSECVLHFYSSPALSVISPG